MQMRYLEENYITITFTPINPPSKQFMSICIQHMKYRGKTHYIPTSIFPLENFLDFNTVIGSNFQSNPSEKRYIKQFCKSSTCTSFWGYNE